MKRIAKFHKVSKERFVADWMDAFEGVAADEAEKIKADLQARNEAVYEIGKVTQGSHEVIVKGGVFDE